MADNLTAAGNTGAGTDVLATDEIGGVHYPRGKMVYGADGAATDVSESNPLPVADVNAAELLQELAIRLVDIADSVGNLSVDTSLRLRVAVETFTATIANITNVGTVTTVTTVGTVSNQTNIGGLSAAQMMLALTQTAEQALRRNVVIT